MRTRTVLLQAHTHQFLGTFGGPGNGDYRGELRQAIGVIKNDATKLGLSTTSMLLRQELPLAPVLWRDWPRCGIRRAWLKVVRSQTVRLESSIFANPSPAPAQISPTLTRAKRAHWRLSWQERLARNARPSNAPRLVVTLHGLPATFARAFGFDLLATA